MLGDKVNLLIEDMCTDPARIARLQAEPEKVYSDYHLDDKEKAALRTGDPLVMVTEANVHPILAMHYLFVAQPAVMEMMSLKEYPDLLRED